MARSLLGSIVSTAAKAADKAIKSAAQERARQVRARTRAADAALKRSEKERVKRERESFILEQFRNGYDYVLISSLQKYRSVMDFDDMRVINEASCKGVNRVFIDRNRLAAWKASLNQSKKPPKSAKPIKNKGLNDMSSH